MSKFFLKTELIIVFIGIILNISIAQYNLEKYDKTYKNYEGESYNQILGSDVRNIWKYADGFRERLSEKKSFWSSLPSYERYFLPSIIVGAYYHIIDKEIYETINTGEKVAKSKNYKFALLLIQILLYYAAIYFFCIAIKNKYKIKFHIFLLIFLSFEPTIIQWHSSFWSESLFITMMIFLFYLLMKDSSNYLLNIFIGVLVGLMFAQRAVSIMFIAPVILYYLIKYKKNFKPTLSVIFGFVFFMFIVGYNNFKKTDHFYFISAQDQYVSYYYYFADRIYANKLNISSEEARNILDEQEKKWLISKNIDLDIGEKNLESIELREDYFKNIKYRNMKFIEIALSNPLYTMKFYIKRTLLMSHFSPTWIVESYYNDRTHPEAKKNAKKYYNRNLSRDISYSLIYYIFIFVGFLSICREIYFKKEFSEYNKFLLFQIFSILYFLSISGFWGNPKYFIPCIINLSFFFAQGLYISLNYFKRK